MNDFVDGLHTTAAAGARATCFAHLTGGPRTIADHPSDGSIGDTVTVTNEHGFWGSLAVGAFCQRA